MDPEVVAGITNSVGIISAFGLLAYCLSHASTVNDKEGVLSTWLPPHNNPAKREFEVWALKYTVCWIAMFGVIIVTKAYERFDANAYMAVCVSISLPYLLQPILWPLPAEKNLPLFMRYSFKANVWIALFSFVGNYWYTHYFYSVLQAFYDFPSLRFNNVPICLYFATHFYFITYHSLSNMLLRKIETHFRESWARTGLFWTAVCGFSYFTAFMETLTISSFEHYGFNVPRSTIYSIGSAFYGLYFLVSYPAFYRLDEKVSARTGDKPHTMYQTCMESLGTGMLVLCFLDFCRLALAVKLTIPGVALCQNDNLQQCAGL